MRLLAVNALVYAKSLHAPAHDAEREQEVLNTLLAIRYERTRYFETFLYVSTAALPLL
jgi:chorismate mutase